MRASAFQRYLDSMLLADAQADPMATRMPSLLSDLERFERDGRRSEVPEVLAASLRHAQALTIHLQWQDRAVPLTIFPPQSLVHCPLAPLVCAISLRGPRDQLLPDIAGQTACRVSPSAHLDGLELSVVLVAAVDRLRRHTTSLREIAEWPGMDRTRAVHLLNALYLTASLIVSRTHPAATSEGWFGYR